MIGRMSDGFRKLYRQMLRDERSPNWRPWGMVKPAKPIPAIKISTMAGKIVVIPPQKGVR